MYFLSLITNLLCALFTPIVSAHAPLDTAIAALKPLLSRTSILTFPNDTRWSTLQVRSSSPRISPHYSVVVEVGVEADVAAVVSVAHRYGVPFLAVSGTHGWTRTLDDLPFGFQINLRGLNRTEVAGDGRTARVGGGTLQWEITRALFQRRKYAVTGLCECVSVAGPLLGGGHSLLQGQHGFALDNLVSARVVTSTGRLVEASRTRNSDLFWALRGAGHNFGIVTSLVVKTYDIPSDWTVYSLVYTGDKLEALFSLVNSFEEPDATRPAKLALTGAFIRIPAVDAKNAVISYTVAYEGNEADAAPYAAPFLALGPTAYTLNTSVNYVELYTVTTNSLSSRPCVPNENILGAGTSLPSWDLGGLRAAFTVFGNLTADPRFAESITLLENYGMQGVRAVQQETTALAPLEREYPILASPILWWKGDDEAATKDAWVYASKMRNALYMGVDRDGGERHTYVNYANGEESRSEVYGFDEWRLDALRGLKKKWDPKNRFGFYNPIV